MSIIRKALAASALAGALAGCGSALAEPTELKVWCWLQNFNVPAAQLAAERFTAKHPDVKITVEEVANDDTIVRMNEALKANDHTKLPDVVLIEDYRVQNFLHDYPDFLKDLSGSFDQNNFAPSKIAISSDNEGRVYGVPFDSGVSTLYVRLDLFEQAGFSLKDLQHMSWDRFIEMGKQVQKVTGHQLIPYDPGDLMEIRLMMQSGGTWYTGADTVTVDLENNKPLQEAFKTFKKLKDEGLLLEYQGWDNLAPTFHNDKVAAVMSACWLASLVMGNEEQSGKWRVVQLPMLNVQFPSGISNQGGSSWYVNNYSPNAALAAQFLGETFGSDRELINELVPKIQLISTMKEAETLSNYQKRYPFFGDQRVLKVMTKWTTSIPAVKYGRFTKQIEDQVVQPALKSYLSGTALEAVLSKAQHEAEAIVKKAK